MAVTDRKMHPSSGTVRDRIVVPMNVAASKSGHVFALIKPGYQFYVESAHAFCNAVGGTLTTRGLIIPNSTGVVQTTTLTVHSTAEQVASTLCRIMVAGVVVEKAAATGITFTANHVISANGFGGVRFQMNVSGTISTKVVASPQAYISAQAAIDNLPAPDAGNVSLGYLIIANNGTTWTANTDDLTDGSDVTTATFTSTPIPTNCWSAITVLALQRVAGTMGVRNARIGYANDTLVLLYTSDASGANTTNGNVTVVTRPFPLNLE